jgi:hypothetical protein
MIFSALHAAHDPYSVRFKGAYMKEGRSLILLIAAVILMHAYSKKNKDGENRLEFLKRDATSGLTRDSGSNRLHHPVLPGQPVRLLDSLSTARLNSFY